MIGTSLWPDQEAVNEVADFGENAPPALYLPAWVAFTSGVMVALGWLVAATVFAWMSAVYRRLDQIHGLPSAPAPVFPAYPATASPGLGHLGHHGRRSDAEQPGIYIP